MDWKTNVTFGGSNLDRAGEIRSNPEELHRLLKAPESRVILFWKGKPALFEGSEEIAAVATDDPILKDSSEVPALLGRDEKGAWFSAELDRWVPKELPDTLDSFLDPSEQRHPSLPPRARFVELRGVMSALDARSAELVATGKAILGWHATHPFCAKCGSRTEIAEAGWQRNCPVCSAKHFPRTDPVVIMLIVSGNSVLLGRSPFWPEGMYSLLAGFVEPGETLEAAVRREVYEESGIRVGAVDYLVSQPWPFPSSLMFGCIGRAESSDINIDPVEIEDALWISKEELAEVFRGTHPKIKSPRKGAVARYLLEAWLKDLPGTRL